MVKLTGIPLPLSVSRMEGFDPELELPARALNARLGGCEGDLDQGRGCRLDRGTRKGKHQSGIGFQKVNGGDGNGRIAEAGDVDLQHGDLTDGDVTKVDGDRLSLRRHRARLELDRKKRVRQSWR